MGNEPDAGAPGRDPFRALWAARALSNLADGVAVAAVPLLAVTLSREPFAVSVVTAASRLPWLIFPLIAGAVVDRVDRRLLIVRSDTVRALLLGLTAAAVQSGWITIPMLAATVFCLAFVEILSDMSAQSLLPGVVGRDRLERANSRLQATELLANQLAGTTAGAFLFAWAAALPFGLDAAAFAASALLVTRLPGSYRPERGEHPRGIGGEIGEGLRWLWGHRVLRTLAMAAGIVNFAGAAVLSLLALYLQEVLRLPPEAYGVILGVSALGGLAGSVIAGGPSRTLGPGAAVIASQAVIGLGALIAVAFTSAVVLAAMLTVMMAAVVVWNVVTVSYRQRAVPDALLGRINSVYRLVAWGSMPLGALAGGAVAQVLGLRAPFWLASGVVTLTLPLLVPVVNNRTLASPREAG